MMTDDPEPHDDSSPPLPLEQTVPVGPPQNVDAVEALVIDDFLDEPSESIVDRPVVRRWYVGLAESFAWFFGMLIVHMIGGVTMIVALLIYKIATQQMAAGSDPSNFIRDPHVMMQVTTGEMLFFVMATMLATTARFWGRTFRELNFSVPDARHLLIVLIGTLPLSQCVSVWSVPVKFVWDIMLEAWPLLHKLDELNSMEAVKQMAESTPLFVMIPVIAVMPAIGEELVFRGVIGRVLICHLGLWGGVLLTSFMFGCIHIHPFHAVTVMPLGLAIHLIYLASRSFWLPMLLHFLNNSWASVVSKWGSETAKNDQIQVGPLELVELGSSFVAVIALAYVLWQSRIRYENQDGQEWYSDQFPVRVPLDQSLRRKTGPMSTPVWFVAVVFAFICHLAFAMDLAKSAAQPVPANEEQIAAPADLR